MVPNWLSKPVQFVLRQKCFSPPVTRIRLRVALASFQTVSHCCGSLIFGRSWQNSFIRCSPGNLLLRAFAPGPGSRSHTFNGCRVGSSRSCRSVLCRQSLGVGSAIHMRPATTFPEAQLPVGALGLKTKGGPIYRYLTKIEVWAGALGGSLERSIALKSG